MKWYTKPQVVHREYTKHSKTELAGAAHAEVEGCKVQLHDLKLDAGGL
jgi:hypothetical protein